MSENNYYCIEGSANMSMGSQIEQYVIDNDKQLFEFHESWIKEVKAKR